jgi:radical SAM family RiPP maturation amino acid epimerase
MIRKPNTNQLNPTNGKNVTSYADVLASFSDEEIEQLVQMKRFTECVQGDTEFRNSLKTGNFTQQQMDYLQEVGVTFDLNDIRLLWDNDAIKSNLEDGFKNRDTAENILEDVSSPIVKNFPLLDLWNRYNQIRNMLHGKHILSIPERNYGDSRYNAWRRRRIAATKSELGSYGSQIDHPALAIELAVGCTVGCHFCAFDAQRLKEVFDYEVPENRKLFQGVAKSLTRLMGPAGASHAMLYWSTEPNDNPHYIDFLKEYEAVTSYYLCTSTARYGEKWVRDLITYYKQFPAPWPRLSVISKKVMQRLHKQFTPMEFRDVWMLMQQEDSEEVRQKVPGGRVQMMAQLEDADDLRKEEYPTTAKLNVRQGSIACISGFLINMVEKTIKLISPCYTSKKYPYGYRTFDEQSFKNVEEFDQVLHEMIQKNMVEAPYSDMPLAFRDDLHYRPNEDGFQLVSPNKWHDFTGNPVWRPLGKILAAGDLTYEQAWSKLVLEQGQNPAIVVASITSLFDRGFLDEVNISAPVTKRHLPKINSKEKSFS